MPTQLFFGTGSAQISRGVNNLTKDSRNVPWRSFEFKTVSGSSLNTTTTLTTAGTTPGMEVRSSSALYYEWLSNPIESIDGYRRIKQITNIPDPYYDQSKEYKGNISSIACSDDGNILVVGCEIDNLDIVKDNIVRGAVYIYSGSSFELKKIITGSNPETNFGRVVHCSGDGNVVFIGYTLNLDINNNISYVKIFSGSNFDYIKTLVSPISGNSAYVNSGTGDFFGDSIHSSPDGTLLVVGAYNTSYFISNELSRYGVGAAYIYTGSNWQTRIDLNPIDTLSSAQYFGRDVKCSADKNIIAVSSDGGLNPSFVPTGIVSLYTGSAFSLVKIVSASDGGELHAFGRVIELANTGKTLIVGTPFATPTDSIGKTYIYTGSNWQTQTILTASIRTTGSLFGHSLAVSEDGTFVCVGAPSEAKNSSLTSVEGKVYVYTGSNWSKLETILVDLDDKYSGTYGRYNIKMSKNKNKIFVLNRAGYYDKYKQVNSQVDIVNVYDTASFAELSLINQPITFNICANESANAANATVGVALDIINNVGDIRDTIVDSVFGTELGTANAKRTWTTRPSASAIRNGERLRARVYFDDATGQTMGSGQTVTFTYNGTLANIGDSNIFFTESINFMNTGSGQTWYLTNNTFDKKFTQLVKYVTGSETLDVFSVGEPYSTNDGWYTVVSSISGSTRAYSKGTRVVVQTGSIYPKVTRILSGNVEFPDLDFTDTTFGIGLDCSDDGTSIFVGSPSITVYTGSSGFAEYFNQGKVTLFTGSNWQTRVRITSSISASSATEFGWVVKSSPDGKAVAISSPNYVIDPVNNGVYGLVYIYSASNNWSTPIKIISSSVSQFSSEFGRTMCWSDDKNILIVGQPGFQSGIEIFTGSDYSFVKRITNEENFSYFGGRLDCSANGRLIVVGSFASPNIYVYTGSNWDTQYILSQPDNIPPNNTRFDNYFFPLDSIKCSKNGSKIFSTIFNGYTDLYEANYWVLLRTGSFWSESVAIIPQQVNQSSANGLYGLQFGFSYQLCATDYVEGTETVNVLAPGYSNKYDLEGAVLETTIKTLYTKLAASTLRGDG